MKHVSIEIIRKCPNNCLHCSSLSGINCKEKIETELVKRVIDGLKKIKVEYISLSGGEPFLHEGLIEIVQYATNKGLKTNIYTSGVLLNNKSIPLEMLKQIKDAGVNKLIFNFQSLKEKVYDQIMNTRGNLKSVKKSIENSKTSGIYTELHFVPMKLNYNEILDIVEYVKENNIDKVSFLGLIPHGRAALNKDIIFLDKDINNKLKALLDNIKNKKIRIGTPLSIKSEQCKCEAGKDKLYIKYDGKVYGCEAFKYIRLYDIEEVFPDSIYEKNIEDIYYNSKYLQVAQEKIDAILKNYTDENCPIQEEIREKNYKI